MGSDAQLWSSDARGLGDKKGGTTAQYPPESGGLSLCVVWLREGLTGEGRTVTERGFQLVCIANHTEHERPPGWRNSIHKMGGRQDKITARRYSPSTSSASTFRIQGVTTGGLHTEVIPSRPPKQTYPTQETKYCRQMGNKKNSLTPSSGNVAHPELLTHRPPRWGLHSWASKRKRSAIAQPHQGLNMVPSDRNP